jgi:hypothetical protein
VLGGWSYFLLAPASTAQTTIALPSDPVFLALPVIAQGFAAGPGLTSLGIVATNGQALTLGL